MPDLASGSEVLPLSSGDMTDAIRVPTVGLTPVLQCLPELIGRSLASHGETQYPDYLEIDRASRHPNGTGRSRFRHYDFGAEFLFHSIRQGFLSHAGRAGEVDRGRRSAS